jgi:hypothetical protein
MLPKMRFPPRVAYHQTGIYFRFSFHSQITQDFRIFFPRGQNLMACGTIVS